MDVDQCNEDLAAVPDTQQQPDMEEVSVTTLEGPPESVVPETSPAEEQLEVNSHNAELSLSNGKQADEVKESAEMKPEGNLQEKQEKVPETSLETPELLPEPESKPPQTDGSPKKTSCAVVASNTEPENTQLDQQPVTKNTPEPIPLADDSPGPEPEKLVEPEPEAPPKPVKGETLPSQAEATPGKAEIESTMNSKEEDAAPVVATAEEEEMAVLVKDFGSEEEAAIAVKDEEPAEAPEVQLVQSMEKPTELVKVDESVPALGSLSFALLEQEQTMVFLRTSRTLVVLRGLPGSGKSLLARSIADCYPDLCTVLCADDHGVKPENPEASADAYKALDEAVVACYVAGAGAAVMVVVDDTNHTQDRLARLGEIAEEQRLVALFLEPRTEWSRDLSQLAKRTGRGFDEAQIKAMKGPLEEMDIPLFFGWFLLPSIQEKIACTSMDFLKTLDTLEIFKKHLTDFTGETEKEVDLEQYFESKGLLHCTSKFCDYGAAEGAKEYSKNPAVKDLYGSVSELSLTALFVTPRTFGARVSLSEEQLVLWPSDAEKEVEASVPAAASLPPGSRAHVTLGCAEGVDAVQTGLDLLEILGLQQEAAAVEEMELGSLAYYGDGRWLLTLREPVSAPACFSSYFAAKAEQTKKEAEKKKKPKCIIL